MLKTIIVNHEHTIHKDIYDTGTIYNNGNLYCKECTKSTAQSVLSSRLG